MSRRIEEVIRGLRGCADYDSMCRLMQKMELLRLGGGCYGCAFITEDGIVVKLGSWRDVTSDYIHACAKQLADHGKPLDFMPRVWHYENIGGSEWFALMEEVLIRAQWSDADCLALGCEHSGRCYRSDMESAFPAKYARALAFVRALDDDRYTLDDHSENYGVTAADERIVIFDPGAGKTNGKTGMVHVNLKAGAGKKRAQWAQGRFAQLQQGRAAR